MTIAIHQARALFEQGVKAFESGQLSQAESCFAKALELAPERPSVLMNLGVVRAATQGLGFTGVGQHNESAKCLKMLHQQGGGDEFTSFMLAAVQHSESGWTQEPPAPPAGYVANLFDRYAEDFSAHLSQLDYRAPEILVKAALECLSPPWPRVLDLGCGTGLAGQSLQGHAMRVDGVDLSLGMVKRAQESGHYQKVWQADIHDAMEQAHRTEDRYNLIVSADVFIYVGALERAFQLATSVLRAGGGLAFSLEEWAEGPEWYVLRPSLRYAHSLAYIQRLASDHGFQILRADRDLLRHDHGTAIGGLFCILQKNS